MLLIEERKPECVLYGDLLVAVVYICFDLQAAIENMLQTVNKHLALVTGGMMQRSRLQSSMWIGLKPLDHPAAMQ